MTQIAVNTTVKLSPIGWIGAGILIGAPLLSGLLANNTLAAIDRGLRYGTFDPSLYTQLQVVGGIGVVALIAGLIMVLVGRSYEHDVTIIRDGNSR